MFSVLKFRETIVTERKIPLTIINNASMNSEKLCSNIEQKRISLLKQNFNLVYFKYLKFLFLCLYYYRNHRFMQ
jgi:hypothetical protein